MPQLPRRLIEVDLPIGRISAHARREKSIRHGHLSTLHVWWARRPLAACRAVILATLWPDPADDACPPSFRQIAEQEIIAFARRVYPAHATPESQRLQRTASAESLDQWQVLATDAGSDPSASRLQSCLFHFIADFANWDNSNQGAYLETARALTAAAHAALGGIEGTRPLVADPFAGGGSIPLESLRIGADAFASDLNPVAVLLNKVVLEYVPRHGRRLAELLRHWGQWVRDRAERELGELYPGDPDGAKPIAYLWARTVRCEAPGCGVQIPLVGNLWLSKRPANRASLAPISKGPGQPVEFQLDPSSTTAARGFTAGNSATCPACGYTTPVARVRSQLSSRRGGSDDAVLLAVVTQRRDGPGKFFRLPVPADHQAVTAARALLARCEAERIGPLPLIPDEACPPAGALGFRFQNYGIRRWRDLYTPRQLATLCTFARIVTGDELRAEMRRELGDELAGVVQTLLALGVGRLNDRLCTLCRWRPDKNNVEAANGGQNKMPMLLDFAESTPFGGSSGDWSDHVAWMARVIGHLADADLSAGIAAQGPAQTPLLPFDSVAATITDPPYYDAFGYSDLSEFFHIWLRRVVPTSAADLRSAGVPKQAEAVSIGKSLADGRGLKDAASYTQAMTRAFEAAHQTTSPDGLAVVVFASKTTAGWESILEALLNAGWIATASWPIDTELANRQRALGSAALTSSVHIVCRPRKDVDGTPQDNVGEWRDVLAELPGRIHAWLPRLAAEGIVGADAIFACLGPALEIFSRYRHVEKASGERVPLREYLEHVWSAISNEALSMVFRDADVAGLEPDARLTAMWLWTLRRDDAGSDSDDGQGASRSAGYTLEYDAARKIAQGLGIVLERNESIVQVKGHQARLLSVRERARHLFRAFADAGRTPKRSNPDAAEPLPAVSSLDRVHQAMLLFADGHGDALRQFTTETGDARFWKLAQSLSALYPPASDEKRWIDGVLAGNKLVSRR